MVSKFCCRKKGKFAKNKNQKMEILPFYANSYFLGRYYSISIFGTLHFEKLIKKWKKNKIEWVNEWMNEEIVIFNTDILIGNVVLWCFFSSETS